MRKGLLKTLGILTLAGAAYLAGNFVGGNNERERIRTGLESWMGISLDPKETAQQRVDIRVNNYNPGEQFENGFGRIMYDDSVARIIDGQPTLLNDNFLMAYEIPRDAMVPLAPKVTGKAEKEK